MKKKLAYLITFVGFSPKQLLAATATGTLIMVETNPLIVDNYSLGAAVICVGAVTNFHPDYGLIRRMAVMLFTLVMATGGAPYLAGFISEQTVGEKIPSELLIVGSSMAIALWRIWYFMLIKAVVIVWRLRHE